jgi:hypothetical protein
LRLFQGQECQEWIFPSEVASACITKFDGSVFSHFELLKIDSIKWYTELKDETRNNPITLSRAWDSVQATLVQACDLLQSLGQLPLPSKGELDRIWKDLLQLTAAVAIGCNKAETAMNDLNSYLDKAYGDAEVFLCKLRDPEANMLHGFRAGFYLLGLLDTLHSDNHQWA